jgi:nicotinate-nucleotide pyrophosphorylase (carboxylating)
MAGEDLRDFLFRPLKKKKFLAAISVQEDGVLSGVQCLRDACRALGLRVRRCKKGGDPVRRGEVVAVVEGSPKQLALAEEQLIGWMAKGSGIATAAAKAKKEAGKKLRVVSGAWKKMPPPVKHLVRKAVVDGGLYFRMTEKPFAYLDKNFIKILGGTEKALRSVQGWGKIIRVVQLKSAGRRLLREAVLAGQLGAHTVMIDTGRKEDILEVDRALKEKGLRRRVQIAFGGDIRIEDLKELKRLPVEVVDVGKAIVDAPLLDMRMDVLGRGESGKRTEKCIGSHRKMPPKRKA